MQKNDEHIVQARGLRADIIAAPNVWIPRREVLLDWLNGFLRRAEASAYELGDTEAADLVALDRFLRKKDVPVAA